MATNRQRILALTGFGLIGFGLGWLIGMALTPVIGEVIGSFLTLTILLLTVVSGLSKESSAEPKPELSEATPSPLANTPQSNITKSLNNLATWHLSPWPLAGLLVGMFLGTGVGNYARANSLLSPPPRPPLTEESLKDLVDPWVTQGMSQTVVVKKIFDLEFEPSNYASRLGTDEQAAEAASGQLDPALTALFSDDNPEAHTACGRLKTVGTDGLREEMIDSKIDIFITLAEAESIEDPILREIVVILCESI